MLFNYYCSSRNDISRWAVIDSSQINNRRVFFFFFSFFFFSSFGLTSLSLSLFALAVEIPHVRFSRRTPARKRIGLPARSSGYNQSRAHYFALALTARFHLFLRFSSPLRLLHSSHRFYFFHFFFHFFTAPQVRRVFLRRLREGEELLRLTGLDKPF